MKYGLSDEIYEIIRKIVNKYNKYEFKIFGSRARGNHKINSDIDIAIVGCNDENDKFNIRNDFDLINIPYTIDIIFIDEITKEELLKSIQKDGIKYE